MYFKNIFTHLHFLHKFNIYTHLHTLHFVTQLQYIHTFAHFALCNTIAFVLSQRVKVYNRMEYYTCHYHCGFQNNKCILLCKIIMKDERQKSV
jgi:hypothetical protein